MIYNAFTCTGPYAILIMLGIKRVENRSVMPAPSKGRCAVSCSKSFDAAEYGNFVQWASAHLPSEDFERIPAWADVKDWPGKVIGACDYSARRSDAVESWNEGYPYWWDLSDIVCFDHPISCRGNVGMWQMSAALAAEVSVADALASSIGEKIATAPDAERLFRASLPMAGKNEGLFVLPLDSNRRALSEPVLVSIGDMASTSFQISDVLVAVLKTDAKSMIVAHNHPSGDPSPSAEDVEMTKQLCTASGLVGVALLDHLILGEADRYVSVLKFINGVGVS